MRIVRALRALLALLFFIGIASLLYDRYGTVLAGKAVAIDGDSLRLNGLEIRLIGIDAPEYRQSCGPPGKLTACGRAARHSLETLLSAGDASCRPEGLDRYQRTLARCLVGGLDVAAEQARLGHAIADERYMIEEAQARAAARGIWAGPFERPGAWRKAHAGE
jgi:endonuclease YncB( thermonuclease family)